MNLSSNITLAEFIVTQHRWLDNTPPDHLIANCRRTAMVGEEIRHVCGDHPIILTSGFRCEALNAAVGGSVSSRHKIGLAMDFIIPRAGTPLEVCHMINQSDILFDQLIYEFGRWVHVGLHPEPGKERRQVLSIVSYQDGYFNGLPSIGDG